MKRDRSGFGAAPKAANFTTELHLESALGQPRLFVPGKDAQKERRQLVQGKGA